MVAHKLKGIRWAMVALAMCIAPAVATAQGGSSSSFWRNRPPVISGTPATSVVAGSFYSFLPAASDPDGNSLTFTIKNRPSWATFSSTTGRLQGTPQLAHVRTYSNIVISVRDGRRTTSLPPFSIVVRAPSGNSAPVISGVPPASVQAGSAYAFTPTASDADNNPLTFGISGRPAWATFDTQTGRLAGTPPAGVAGVFGNIVISVSDGTATTALPGFSITVTVPATNTAPTITGTPLTSVRQGTPYVFQPTAADANGDPLTFTIANRPAWASFNNLTGTLQGTPGTGTVGTYGSIVIAVNDGQVSTALPAFAIAVTAANTAPTISGTPPTAATVGTQYAFTPTASDVNGDTLTFSIANRPTWATFNTSTGRLQGTPTTAGAFSNIVISVSDGQASASLPAFAITVTAPPNPAPTISGTPATSVMQGTPYAFQPTASDANGDVLTFSIVNRPAWATFTASTGRLAGTPAPANVGTTSGIVITVTDGTSSRSLPAFSITVQSAATGSAVLSWLPPTQNSDGSPLTNLAGYKVYWGTSPGTYPNSVTLNNPGLATYVVANLVPGTYYFVMTAFNTIGAESLQSNPASKTIP